MLDSSFDPVGAHVLPTHFRGESHPGNATGAAALWIGANGWEVPKPCQHTYKIYCQEMLMIMILHSIVQYDMYDAEKASDTTA